MPAPRLADSMRLDELLLRRADLSASTAADMRLAECRLEEVDLDGSHLLRAGHEDVAVAGGSWANTRIPESRLRRVAFEGVRLTGADFASGSLEDVTFTDCRADLTSFRFASLERVLFDRCRLEEIDFYGAELKSVTFRRCVMTSGVWAEATLTRCEIRETDISGATNPERLRGVRMTWPDVLSSAGVLAAAAGIEIID